jgi:hypothetical protein
MSSSARQRWRNAGVAGVLIVVGAVSGWSQTVYVDSALGDDSWTGQCEVWDGLGCGPKATIQAAIGAAVAGDEVLIADGLYAGPGNRDLDFGGKAITVRSASGDPDACIIDCEYSGRGFCFQTAETPSSIVQGLTIFNAYGDFGGGVRCDGASPQLVHCTIRGNTASMCGGGVYCLECSPVLIDCTLAANTKLPSCGAGGGGICLVRSSATLINCTISGNILPDAVGGGVYCTDPSTPLLIGCTITGNYAGGGAGLWCSDCTPALISCTITCNRSGSTGGGIGSQECNPNFVNCTIMGNAAPDGAALYLTHCTAASVTNCIIAGNVAYYHAGGLYCSSTGVALNNCTIVGNTAGQHGAALYGFNVDVTLSNCILWANAPGQFGLACSPVATYCDIEGGWPGVGNLDADPLFFRYPNDGGDGWGDDPASPEFDESANDDYGNLRLMPGAPCIDAGSNSAVPADMLDVDGDGDTSEPLPLDLAGRSRFSDDALTPDTGSGLPPVVDMGCYENFRPGDLDCDGSINTFDIDPFVLALTSPAIYGMAYQRCDLMQADCNADGVVNAFDIDPFVALLVGG